MRFFNTAGPVRSDDHSAMPPLDRMDVEALLAFVRDRQYFVLHAPRQTGKTSALIALRDLLNSGEVGDFRCVNVNVEVAQMARDDVAEGMRAVLSSLADSALPLGDEYPAGVRLDVLADMGPENALKGLLTRWCKAGRDRSRAIEEDDVYAAREELILSRRTHLDQLAHKLEEARVRRVVEPMRRARDSPRSGRVDAPDAGKRTARRRPGKAGP